MYTRKQYMDNEVSHEEYYAQFGIHLIKLVENSIGSAARQGHLIQWV